MGKAKKQSNKSQRHNELIIPSNRVSQNDKFALSELEANIGSLNEKVRSDACLLLSDLFYFNSQTKSSMDILASNKILSKLAMRLVDHSSSVKYAATKALRVLTETNNIPAIDRVITVGIFQTLLTLSRQSLPHDDESVSIQQNILYAIANIISSRPEAIDEIVTHQSDFIQYLIHLLTTFNTDIRILNTVANSLVIISKIKSAPLINDLLGVKGLETIRSIENSLLQGILQGTNQQIVYFTKDHDHWIILLQVLEIYTYLYLNPVLSPSMKIAIPLEMSLNILSGVFHSFKSDKSSELNESTRMFPIDLLEMFADLITALSTSIESILEHSLSNSQTLKTSTTFQNALELFVLLESKQFVHLLWFDLLPLVHVYFPSYLNHIDNGVIKIPHEGIKVLVVIEKLLTAWNDFYRLKSGMKEGLELIGLEYPALSIDWCVDIIGPKLDLMPVIIEWINHTTAQLDQATNFAVENWKSKEEDDLVLLKTTILNIATMNIDSISSLINNLPYLAQDNRIPWSSDQLKVLIISIIRWLNLPQFEVLLSIMNLISSLIVINEQYTTSDAILPPVTPEAPIPYIKLLPTPLHFLLINGLLKRLQNPSCYALQLLEGKKQTFNKTDNQHYSTFLIMDHLINDIIDLNANDDEEYHNNFMKLKCLDHFVNQSRNIFASNVAVYKHLLDELEQEKVTETLENLDNFIVYKQNWDNNDM